jgi:hypothetical protein
MSTGIVRCANNTREHKNCVQFFLPRAQAFQVLVAERVHPQEQFPNAESTHQLSVTDASPRGAVEHDASHTPQAFVH